MSGGGRVRQEKPVIYQLMGGRRQEVAGRYAISASGEIGFKVGRYDRGRPLVIDPVLSYSTYLGGTGDDRALDIALDGQGNAYITGETSSIFDAGDAFVLKLNPSGTAPVYATYFGGESFESGLGVAVDAAGNAYVTGETESNTFSGVPMPKQGNPVYKSGDAGVSWSAHRSGLPDPNIAGLAVDPTNSSILYAAGQFGVFKSLDGGASWGVTGLRSSLGSILTTSVVVDPSTPTTIYASAFGTVYKSTNGGGTWSHGSVRRENGDGSLTFNAVSCVALDPNNRSTLYACAFDGVYKSVSGGAFWTKSSSGFAQDTIRVNKIVLDPTNSQILYAATQSGIYKSTDGAATWATANNGLLSASGTTPLATSLAISPASPATIYAGTSAGMFKSSDGGQSWASSNDGLRVQVLNGDALIPAITAIEISRAETTTIYAGTSQGGVFKSTDGGARWAASNNGLANTVVTGLALDHSAAATLYASANSLSDGFVVKLDATGANLGYLRYLGGHEDDFGARIAVDAGGNAYVTGGTRSTNFPTLNAAQAVGGGVFYDAFVTKVGSDGSTVYSTYLGRIPIYVEFQRGLQQVTGATPEEVVAGQAAFAADFATRSDFRRLYDGLSLREFVTRLLQMAGVELPGREQLIADLESGRKTRAQALREVVESREVYDAHFNRGFVAMQYFGYLRRDPERDGFLAWLNFLNRNPQDYRTMVNGFVNSREYRLRFGPP